MTSSQPADLKYRPDVDGLRAVAVVAVVLFHAGFGCPGGYVGVDVFFVISGFLITRLIQRQVAEGSFSYREFWARRARRLIPALIVVLLATMAAGYVLMLPHDYKELGQASVAQSVGLANFYYWREAGYFAGPSELKPLLHTWSLAVEEQFYLLMPMVMVVSYRFWGASYARVLACLALVSVGWSVYATSLYPDASFYLLPARAWELLLGGLLVSIACRWRPGPRIAEAVSILGLLAIFYSILAFGSSTVFPGVAAILPSVGTAAVILANAHHKTTAWRVLSWRPIVFVGLISYSLYLWHWPLLVFARYMGIGEGDPWTTLMLIVIAFCVSALSWRYVEIPFRTAGFWSANRRVFAGAAACLAVVFVAGLALHATGGMRNRFSEKVLQLADARSDRNPWRHLHHDISTASIRRDGLPRLGKTPDDRPPVIAVIGDSHADALMPAVAQLASEYNVPTVAISRSATIPLLYDSRGGRAKRAAFYEAVSQQLGMMQQLSDVVLVARWAGYEQQEFTLDAWNHTLNELNKMGLRVWVVRAIPEPPVDVPRALALAEHWKWSSDHVSISLEEHHQANRRIDRIFRETQPSNIQFVEPADLLFDGEDRALVQLGGRPLYFDDDHLSAFGARQLAPLLRPIFAASQDGAGLADRDSQLGSETRPDVASLPVLE